MLHCDLRLRWKVASDLRFRAAMSEPKTPSFCRISGDLAPSTRKSLAIATVRFWCAKPYKQLSSHLAGLLCRSRTSGHESLVTLALSNHLQESPGPGPKIAKSLRKSLFGPAFGRMDFSRIFIFEPPDFFADFLAGFFLLIFVGKSAQKNPPGKSPGKSSKIYTTKILQHISADCPGQSLFGGSVKTLCEILRF